MSRRKRTRSPKADRHWCVPCGGTGIICSSCGAKRDNCTCVDLMKHALFTPTRCTWCGGRGTTEATK